MATYELRPLSVGEILDTAFAVYRRLFGTLMSLGVICIGIPLLVLFALRTITPSGDVSLLALVFDLVLIAGTILLEGAIVCTVSDTYLGRAPSTGNALRTAWAKGGSIFAAGFVRNILIFVGLLFLIVPGIIVACGLSVAIPAVVLEPETLGTDAISRSWELTKGFRGTAFVLALVPVALYLIPQLAAGMTSPFLPALAPVFLAISIVIQLLVIPGAICVFTLFYYDLRVRKEGFDLEQLSVHLGDESASAPA